MAAEVPSATSATAASFDAAPSDEVLWGIVEVTGDIPQPRYCSSTAVLGDKVFMFGGSTKAAPNSTGTRLLNDFYCFDAGFRKWTCLNPGDGSAKSPSPRHSHTLASHGNRIVLFGGCGEGSVALGDLWFYDLDASSWTKVLKSGVVSPGIDDGSSVHQYNNISETPNPAIAAHAYAHSSKRGPGGRSSVAGFAAKRQASMGMSGSPQQPGTTAATTSEGAAGSGSGQWPKQRYLHSSVVYNDGMYVYGGWMSDWTKGDKIWRLDLTGLYWQEVDMAKGSPMPERRFGHVACVWADCLYIFGGSRSTKTTNEMWMFDFKAKRWTQLEQGNSVPHPRKRHAGVVVGNRWLVHGGVAQDAVSKDAGDEPFVDAHCFDFRTSAWSAIPRLNSHDGDLPCDSHNAVLVNGEFCSTLYLLFGRPRRRAIACTNTIYGFDLFRPMSHSQLDDDEACFAEAMTRLERVMDSTFRLDVEDLADHLSDLRHTFINKTLPNLEAQFRKVTSKVGSTVSEHDRRVLMEASSNLPTDPQEIIRLIYEGLKEMDRLSPPHPAESGVAAEFVRCLASILPGEHEISDDTDATLNLLIQAAAADSDSTAVTGLLKYISEALQLLEVHREEFANTFVRPSGGAAVSLPGNQLLQNFNLQLAEYAQKYLAQKAAVSDTSVPARQKKAAEIARAETYRGLLLKLKEKSLAFQEYLKSTPPETLSAVEENLAKDIDKATELKAICEKNIAREEKIINYLDKMQADRRATSETTMADFDQKRCQFVSQRSQILQDLKAVMEQKIQEYQAALEAERQFLIEAELHSRETMETTRRIVSLKDEMEEPRLHKKAVVNTLEKVVIPMLQSLRPVEAAICTAIQDTVGKSSLPVAEEAVKDTVRFAALVAAAKTSLERQIVSAENSLKILQGRAAANVDILSVMESLGEAEAVDLLNEQKRPVASRDEITRQLEDIKEMQHSLEEELKLAKSSLTDMEYLSEEYAEVITSIRRATSEPSDDTSNLSQLIKSGFDWNATASQLNKVASEEELIEWMRSLTLAGPPTHRGIEKPSSPTAGEANTPDGIRSRGVAKKRTPSKPRSGTEVSQNHTSMVASTIKATSRGIQPTANFATPVKGTRPNRTSGTAAGQVAVASSQARYTAASPRSRPAVAAEIRKTIPAGTGTTSLTTSGPSFSKPVATSHQRARATLSG